MAGPVDQGQGGNMAECERCFDEGCWPCSCHRAAAPVLCWPSGCGPGHSLSRCHFQHPHTFPGSGAAQSGSPPPPPGMRSDQKRWHRMLEQSSTVQETFNSLKCTMTHSVNMCGWRQTLTLAWQLSSCWVWLSSSAFTLASWESFSSTLCSCRARWCSVSSCSCNRDAFQCWTSADNPNHQPERRLTYISFISTRIHRNITPRTFK